MQSFLQYRQIGFLVRKQIQKESDIEHSCTYHTLPPLQQQIHHIRQQEAHLASDAIKALPETSENGNADKNLPLNQNDSVCLTQIDIPKGSVPRGVTTREQQNIRSFVVTWDNKDDITNPRNWTVAYRVWATLNIAFVSIALGAATSSDAAILPQAAADFGVSDIAESMSIGLFLVGYAVGAIFAGSFSETFGRNSIYISTLVIFMAFIMGSALAPNIGAQLSFRFLAGVFGATPLTCAGGSISDMWPSLEKTFAFPLFAIVGFAGPTLGPVISSHIMNIDGNWRWAEWIILIMSALALFSIIFFQPETFPPLLLKWKARHYRLATQGVRYKSEFEDTTSTLWSRLKTSLTRPLVFALEPIVLLMTMYLTVIYIILFTFLPGFPFIFETIYGVSQGLTNVLFTAMYIGILLSGFLVPSIYKMAKDDMDKGVYVPEARLWFAMIGAPAVSIALFLIAWTDFLSISIWSPIFALVLFGFGLSCIFLTGHMYIIDAYEIYAASALALVTFTRYIVAGGITVVGIPMYKNLGPHWTLTILGGISVLMTPIPFVLYKHGYKIREKSKYAEVST